MIWDLLAQLRQRITASLEVEGFEIGFADYPTGEEGSGHAFVHLIARIPGESAERPRGVEWVDLGLQ